MKPEKEHKHELDFVNWYSRPLHYHEYYTRTTVNQRHSHLMGGSTSVASGGNDSHVHYYKGTTSFDDGHVHYFRGTTGPAIPLPGGGHVHELMGQTSYADGHLHYYRGRTGGGISAM